jgi:DNA-binding transcriptional LysR family regulator
MATVDPSAVRVFVAVAHERSFSAAAKRLALHKSQVSRVVRAVEEAVGAPLLLRTTRSVRLTPEGEGLYERVAPLIAGLEEAVAGARARAATPAGEVTLTATPDVGRVLLVPLVTGFRAANPGVRVRVLLTHERLDLQKVGVDLALRVGRLESSSYVARKVADLEAAFFAAPAYLERRGLPRALEDLQRHDGLWPPPPPGRAPFADGGAAPAPAVESADFSFLAALARAGGGVALLPTLLARADVARGELVRVLPGTTLRQAPLYLVSRAVRALPPRVAALRAHLLEGLAADGG